VENVQGNICGAGWTVCAARETAEVVWLGNLVGGARALWLGHGCVI
jgi:hypothetical protein